MSLSAYVLYLTTVLIWGSTWLGIEFQLGEVDPLVSVVYRFALASLMLFAWCALRRARLRLTIAEHAGIALQGVFLFGINYWLVYWAEVYLTSGLVAMIFAWMVFMNALNGALFLKRPVAPGVVPGGVIGIGGMALLFWPEFRDVSLDDDAVRGLLLALAAAYCASLGSVIAVRNARFGLPVISVNAWGMCYGTLLLVAAAFATDVPFHVPTETTYLASLLYLSVFGSVIAFGAYLRLLALVGPDRAGYHTMMTPVVALALSTLFEGYQWTPAAFGGLAMIALGNLLVLRRRVGAGSG